MTQSKYAADIAAIKIAQAERAITQAENAVVLRNIAERQGETLAEVQEITKCLKRHDREIVALATWREGHQESHQDLIGDVRTLRGRVTAIGTANALWAAAISGITAVFTRQN